MIVEQDVSLKAYNTFGIDATAKKLYRVQTIEDVREILPVLQNGALVLGGGSNVLLCSDVDVVVINEIIGKHIIAQDERDITIEFGAGEVWHHCVEWAVLHNYGGIENMALIPGTIGAAPIQNIGAYGVEVESCVVSVQYIDITSGEVKELDAASCRFGYRDSIFKHELKHKVFITSVKLKLSKQPIVSTTYKDVEQELLKTGIIHPTIHDVFTAVVQIRSRKLPNPKQLGNAGSFFKNPVISVKHFEELVGKYPAIPSYNAGDGFKKVPAAWLIEQAGFKGKQVGNTGTHVTQPLVLVNYGNASGREILALASEIQSVVYRTFAIQLEMEVNIIQ